MEPAAQDERTEYEQRGMITRCFDLADPTIAHRLAEELPIYEAEATRLAETDVSSVPYLITPAVEELVTDAGLDQVVRAVLGGDWVMWGANTRRGVPNRADCWHVDIESRLWPTMTAVVGLSGCDAGNSTWYVPGSHNIRGNPPPDLDCSRTSEVLTAAQEQHPSCGPAVQFANFADGRFYLFNANGWHAGDLVRGGERVLLFTHFNLASDPRIPLMRDFRNREFFDAPAPFIAGPAVGTAAVSNELAEAPLSRVAVQLLQSRRKELTEQIQTAREELARIRAELEQNRNR